MITDNKSFDGISTHNKPCVFYCLSTDILPIKGTVNGSIAIIMDSRIAKIFDEENKTWRNFCKIESDDDFEPDGG